MAGSRRKKVPFILERERIIEESEQTVWVISEADHLSYEKYSSATELVQKDKKGRRMSARVPFEARAELFSSNVCNVKNFDGKDFGGVDEMKKLVRDVHPSDLDEICAAIIDASVLTEGMVKNYDASSDSNPGSKTTTPSE